MSTYAPDVLLSDALEAEARRVMARRAVLVLRWDTRGERAELMAEAEHLLDRWLEVVADDGQARLP